MSGEGGRDSWVESSAPHCGVSSLALRLVLALGVAVDLSVELHVGRAILLLGDDVLDLESPWNAR